MNIFITVFALIFVAELPDKTAFATFLMATRGKPLAIFAGVAAAFVVQSLIAVGFGSLIGLMPEKWVHAGTGLLFLGFAAHTWFFHDKEEAEVEDSAPELSSRLKFWVTAWKSFVVIFIAEWGDMTQLATASLAARYHDHPAIVFLSATLALWAVTVIAVFAGKKAGQAVHTGVLKKLGTALFACAGLYFVASVWFR
jgi:putative Ca2+/H+ antiporter (TMEM165/GDT1 family)